MRGSNLSIRSSPDSSRSREVPTDREVIAIAGTGWLGGGADCALIVKQSSIPKSRDLEKGLEVGGIIAIPE